MGIIYTVGKLAAKFIAKSATKDINELAGMKVGVPFVYTIEDRVTDLKYAKGVSQPFIDGIIDDANKPEQLKIVLNYLSSTKNDLPTNVTLELMKKTMQKMGDVQWQEHLSQMKNKWLAEHASQAFETIIHHTKEMI